MLLSLCGHLIFPRCIALARRLRVGGSATMSGFTDDVNCCEDAEKTEAGGMNSDWKLELESPKMTFEAETSRQAHDDETLSPPAHLFRHDERTLEYLFLLRLIIFDIAEDPKKLK